MQLSANDLGSIPSTGNKKVSIYYIQLCFYDAILNTMQGTEVIKLSKGHNIPSAQNE